jgi:hypothetical protein
MKVVKDVKTIDIYQTEISFKEKGLFLLEVIMNSEHNSITVLMQ